MRKTPITEEEEQKILQLLEQGVGKRDISKKLKIDYKPLKKYFDEHNIANKKQGIPFEFYNKIAELYISGLNCRQISEQYFPQYTEDQIYYVCKEKGITRRVGKQVILNHEYFNIIDSSEKAYWLGLLTADGSIRQDHKRGNSWSITLELMKEDKYLVEAFAEAVGTNKKVKEYYNNKGFQRQDGQPHIECRIVINSPEMANDLINKYHVVPNKSIKLNYLPILDDVYMSHYIRGFIDGNGSFTHHISHGKYMHPRISIYSTHSYCELLNDFLSSEIGISKNKVFDQKQERVSFISYGKFSDIETLYEYLYKDATIYMKRKKEKLEDLISEYRDNHAA